jgi:putative membrane protein insertion efficiency factor
MVHSFYITLTLFLLFSSGINVFAQQIDTGHDIQIIGKKLSGKKPDPYRRPYMYKNEPSIIKKINPLNVLFGSTLYVYQNTISRQISATCLYSPSCSDFAKNAVRHYGLIKGGFLSVDRLTRCNRISETGLMKNKPDPLTKKYPDPASKYNRIKRRNGK